MFACIRSNTKYVSIIDFEKRGENGPVELLAQPVPVSLITEFFYELILPLLIDKGYSR
jgi:hypothetical protein